jgi:ribose transport system ATP-binding protein
MEVNRSIPFTSILQGNKSMTDTLLAVKDIVKTYPGVVAIDNLSFDLKKGEVHALIGENGAGKSTLIKILSGAIVPDSGTITIEGKDYTAMTPKLAKSIGIEVIYQEFTLIPGISAAENIFLGEKTKPGIFVDIKEREARARKLFESMHVDIDVSKPVRSLSPAYQQIVEIAKAISKNLKILIMDEPTAPLMVSEVQTLFSIVKDLKKRGVTIIYISHRLEELFEIADRITVMRDGCYVGTESIADVTRERLISMMVGRTVSENYPQRKTAIGKEIFRVEHLSGNGDYDISFNLHQGEILGFSGLVGAGRTELMRVIYGANACEGGKIFLENRELKIRNCSDAIRNGIGYIPEDRKTQGAFLRMSIKWNIAMNNLRNLSRGIFLSKAAEQESAETYCKLFEIKTPGIDQKVMNLSGGNQQKVVIAKTIAASKKVIIFDEPTRGIDVKAKQEIYALMNNLVRDGNAIIMISSDMPELLGMSDRIAVIYEGRKNGEVMKSEFDQNYILDLASGGRSHEKAE